MISLAHKFMNLGFQGYSTDRRPGFDEYVGLNWDSQHSQDLIACWPMWGPPGADVIVDLTPYQVKAYQVNEAFDPYVWDDQMGWCYQGDSGGTPRGGGAAAHSSGYQVLTYPQHLDRGYVATSLGAINAQSISFTAWYRAVTRAGLILDGNDISTVDLPPNAYFCTFDSPANSFPGFGFAVAAPTTGATGHAILAELDIDGSSGQATIIGQFGRLNDGQWHHITGVYEVSEPANASTNSGGQGRMQLYVDGLVDTTDINGAAGNGTNPVFTPAMASVLDSTGNGQWKFYIGVDDDGTAAAMNGRFCDLRIYGTALTPSEALHMWTADSRWELYRPRRYYSVWTPPPAALTKNCSLLLGSGF